MSIRRAVRTRLERYLPDQPREKWACDEAGCHVTGREAGVRLCSIGYRVVKLCPSCRERRIAQQRTLVRPNLPPTNQPAPYRTAVRDYFS